MSTLAKTNGFPSLKSMMEDFWNTDGFFSPAVFNREVLPAVNIKDTKKGFELEVAAPGFQKEDFKITTENGVLTISAETKNEQKEETDNYTRREFTRSSFTRTFSLPDNVLADNIKASYKDGLLSVELEKDQKAAVSRKQIAIA